MSIMKELKLSEFNNIEGLSLSVDISIGYLDPSPTTEHA